MTLLDRLAGRFGYIKAAPPEYRGPRLVDRASYHDMPDMAIVGNQADLMRKLSWVHIAIKTFANTAAGTALGVKQMIGEDTKEIDNHPFELRLKKPNPYQSRHELFVELASYYALTGNAYWWLNMPNGPGEPVEIFGVPPQYMRPVPDGNLGVKGYLYTPEGSYQPIPIPKAEIVHFKTFNPRNRYVGLSPIEALANQAIGDIKQTEWNRNLFAENNAKLSGALAFADMITDADWERINQEAKDQHGGTRRNLMMLRGVGDARGVSWIQMGISQKDMEFLAGREFTKEEIFATFAPGLSSVLAVNATEANALAGRASFMDFSIWPFHVAVAEKISNNVLPLYGENLMAEFEDVRVVDRATALQEQQAYERTHTIDEIRLEFYNDQPMEYDGQPDERGTLLPAQVSPSTPAPGQEPNPIPPQLAPYTGMTPQQTQQQDQQQGNTGQGADVSQSQIEQAQQRLSTKAYKSDDLLAMEDELRKWRRVARKRANEKHTAKAAEFTSEILPAPLVSWIAGGLETAQNTRDVAQIFDSVALEEWEHYFSWQS